MPEPKPPEGYDTWLDFLIVAMGSEDELYEFRASGMTIATDSRCSVVHEGARAELAKLREEAEKWRTMKPALKTFGLKLNDVLEPYWDDENAN